MASPEIGLSTSWKFAKSTIVTPMEDDDVRFDEFWMFGDVLIACNKKYTVVMKLRKPLENDCLAFAFAFAKIDVDVVRMLCCSAPVDQI